MLDFPKINGQTRSPKPEHHSPLPMFSAHWPRLLQRLDTLANFLKTKSFSQLPLLPDSFGFLEGTGPSPSHPLWTISTSLPRSQPSLFFLRMQDKTEGEFFLHNLRTLSAGSNSLPSGLSRIRASLERYLRHYFIHF